MDLMQLLLFLRQKVIIPHYIETTQTTSAPPILLIKEDERSSMYLISFWISDTVSRSGTNTKLIIVG